MLLYYVGSRTLVVVVLFVRLKRAVGSFFPSPRGARVTLSFRRDAAMGPNAVLLYVEFQLLH